MTRAVGHVMVQRHHDLLLGRLFAALHYWPPHGGGGSVIAPDTTTREGAEALARKLDAFWHAQGHTQVQHWVAPQPRAVGDKPHRGQSMWVVRSNLIRGQPPRSTA